MKRYLMKMCAALWVVSFVCVFGHPAHGEGAEAKKEVPAEREIAEKDFSGLMGMEGFSDKLLEDHLKLYKGYVNNSKVLLGKLRELLKDNKGNTPEYAELKRRLGWEMDGMILHEYYFENLGGDGKPDTESALYAAIIKDFGSFEKWKEDIISTGSMRGIGWAVLYYDPRTERLVNIWVNEHDTGHIAAGRPILVIDVFEHAYMTDYRLERGKYIGAFFKNIDWKTAQERYDHVN